MTKKTRKEIAIEILDEEIRKRRNVIQINYSQVTSLEDSIILLKLKPND